MAQTTATTATAAAQKQEETALPAGVRAWPQPVLAADPAAMSIPHTSVVSDDAFFTQAMLFVPGFAQEPFVEGYRTAVRKGCPSGAEWVPGVNSYAPEGIRRNEWACSVAGLISEYEIRANPLFDEELDARIMKHIRDPTPMYSTSIMTNQAANEERTKDMNAEEYAAWQHEALRCTLNACAEGTYMNAGVSAEDRALAGAASLVARGILQKRVVGDRLQVNGECVPIGEFGDTPIVYLDSGRPFVVDLCNGTGPDDTWCVFRVTDADVPELPGFTATVDKDVWLLAYHKFVFLACVGTLLNGSDVCFCDRHDLQLSRRHELFRKTFKYSNGTGLLHNFTSAKYIADYDLDEFVLPHRELFAV